MRIPKYGMTFRTIKYYQDAAKNLWLYNGIISRVSTFDGRNLAIASARDIGHAAISIAAAVSPARLAAILAGTDRASWKGGR
jgi:hypothetical protein